MESLHSKIASESAKVATERGKESDARQKALKASSVSTAQSRSREADRHGKAANDAEKRRSVLEKELASKQKGLHQSDAKLDRQRAQAQQRAMKRLEDRARAGERQFRPLAASPSSPALTSSRTALEQELTHDVFICHASEDKDLVARPLAELLRGHGVAVWYDEFSLTVGDSLRRKIDRGLSDSRFGVVLLSPDFFRKA